MSDRQEKLLTNKEKRNFVEKNKNSDLNLLNTNLATFNAAQIDGFKKFAKIGDDVFITLKITDEDLKNLTDRKVINEDQKKLLSELITNLKKFNQEMIDNNKNTKAQTDKLKNDVIQKYKDIMFLVDDDSKLDDSTKAKNIRQFKKMDAQAFGGSENLLVQLGSFYTRFAGEVVAGENVEAKQEREKGFVTMIVKKFGEYLTAKNIGQDIIDLRNITTLEALKAKFLDANNKPVMVSVDSRLDGKDKKQQISVTELFVNSISSFTGNLDKYFGTTQLISEKYKQTEVNIAGNPEDAVLALNIYMAQNPDAAAKGFDDFMTGDRATIKTNIQSQIQTEKDPKAKKTMEAYLKNPQGIYFNGLVLGYMQHIHTTTLQHLDKGKVTKTETGVSKNDIYTLGASIGKQIGENLSAILLGTMSYANGKIIPAAGVGLSQSLGKGFSASINAGTLLTNLSAMSVMAGISKRFSLNDGSNKGTANVDLSLFAGSNLLNNFVPSAGVSIDRNKMLGIANFIKDLEPRLTTAITLAVLGTGDKKKTIVDNIYDAGKKSGIDQKLATEIADDILPLVNSLGNVYTTDPKEQTQLAKTIRQDIVIDGILTNIITQKYKSSNKFSRGGVGVGTNDIVGLGVPFLVRVLGSGVKQNNVRSTISQIETKQDIINTEGVYRTNQRLILNQTFGREQGAKNAFGLDDNGNILVPTGIKILGTDGITEQTDRFIDTRLYNISVDKNGVLKLSNIDAKTEKKDIDMILLNNKLKGYFSVRDNGDNLTFTNTAKIPIITSILKESIKTNGIKINTKELSVVVNPDNAKKPGQIDKIELTDTTSSIQIDLPSSESYKTHILVKILGADNKKTVEGQKLTYDIKYSDHNIYEAFSTEMKSENVNYTNAANLANSLLAKYNAKNNTKQLNHNFDKQNKNDLLSFFVALISYEYAVGKVNNPQFDADFNNLTKNLESGLKKGVDTILSNKTQSLYGYRIGNQTALERAKQNLSKDHKQLYLKLLTVGDIATKEVFYKDVHWIKPRNESIKLQDGTRGISEIMIHYTDESLKLVGSKRSYGTDIIPIGFVLGYPGEKLAANLEIISGSKVPILNTSDDKKIRKYAFENLIKNIPALAKLNLANAEIDSEGNMIIDESTKVSVDRLEFGLYAHCNGNHSILATGLKLIKTTKDEISESILTSYGNLNIETASNKVKLSGGSKTVFDVLFGKIYSKNTVTMSTSANDNSLNTSANDILGKEIKVTIDGVEKTVKIFDLGNGKLQMVVVAPGTAQIYTLTPSPTGTLTIGNTSYTVTLNAAAGTPATGTVPGIPASGNTPVRVVISSTATPATGATIIPASGNGTPKLNTGWIPSATAVISSIISSKGIVNESNIQSLKARLKEVGLLRQFEIPSAK